MVKLTVGKNPVDQFWDKLGRISIFWRNYFNGGLIGKIHKDKIFSHEKCLRQFMRRLVVHSP
jgi:hypothetical protein